MFVTWKVSDIFEGIEIIIHIFFFIFCFSFPFSCPLFLYGVGYSIAWIYTTPIEDLIYVVPLTFEEQKEMGQLHHCKVYQDQCRYYVDGRSYSCDTSNM